MARGNLPSTQTHKFSQVPRAEIQRSKFDRSHGHKTTFDAGYLIPIFCDEALPGDTFNLSMTGFARLATPIFPIMDNMQMDTFFFAVPIRLLWDHWPEFMGEQKQPGATTDYLVPQIVSPPGGYAVGQLSDYIGIPPLIGGLSHSAFWHRAYNLIYNEWFRDQNLEQPRPVNMGDGPDVWNDYSLCFRGKRHDYFTSALPWPQKGPGVSLPIGGRADIHSGGAFASTDIGEALYWPGPGNTSPAGPGLGSEPGNYIWSDNTSTGGPTNTGVWVDLGETSAITINSLRQAFQIQKMFERDARGGTRYIETIRNHFGVTSPDARQQRPEFLGGGSSPVNVSPVPQTSSTDGASPQGNLAAIGTASLRGHGFTSSFTEHCVLIGLISVRADLTYQQGLNRMFSRKTKVDHFWPALAMIGEQAILRKEIYAQGTPDDDLVFGYQERFAEYRYKPSMISGEFRSAYPESLDAWHLAQEFETAPVLGDTFIRENPPIDRIVAVPAAPHFLFDSYFRMICARPMPVYGVPGLIDHF